MLGVSGPVEALEEAYNKEAAGGLAASMMESSRVARFGPGGDWKARAVPVAEAAALQKPRAMAVALRAARERPSEERAAERALRDLLPGIPVLLSSDIAPLWGWADHPVEKTLVSAG